MALSSFYSPASVCSLTGAAKGYFLTYHLQQVGKIVLKVINET